MAQKCEEEDLNERKNKILTPFKNGEPDKAFAAFKESDFSLTTTYTQFMIDNGYQKEITEYLNDFQTYAGIYLDTEKTDTFTYEQKRRLEYLRDYYYYYKIIIDKDNWNFKIIYYIGEETFNTNATDGHEYKFAYNWNKETKKYFDYSDHYFEFSDDCSVLYDVSSSFDTSTSYKQ